MDAKDIALIKALGGGGSGGSGGSVKVDSELSATSTNPVQNKVIKSALDAISIPDKLPNPNALTFTGAVTGTYDGSEALTVEIPSGGGGISRDWAELGVIDFSVVAVCFVLTRNETDEQSRSERQR